MQATELRALSNGTALGSGAFGTVYADPLDPNRCIKVFARPVIGTDAQALLRLSEVARWARPSDIEQFTTRFAWPLRVFGSANEVTGFAMPRAQKSCFFQLTAVNRTQTTSLQLKFLMDAGYWKSAAIQSAPPAISDQDRLEIAIDCLDSLQLLHQHGLCYGDLSSNNLCARLDARPGVFFFDADSISTVDVRAANPLVTPGWETPSGLAPAAIDRSRAAILVLRLITQDLNVVPERSTTKLLRGTEHAALASGLLECFSTGSQESMLRLASDLRALRNDDREERAIREAYDSGFASRVVLEVGQKGKQSTRQMLKLAEDHILIEHRIDEGDGLERRTLAQRTKIRGGPFVLDVKPRVELRDAPTSLSDLHQLIYDARFTEIISHYTTAGFGALEVDSWLERGVQHGLVEIPDSTMSLQIAEGEASISFTWPASPYVNCARLRIETDDGRVEEAIVQRDPVNPNPIRLISAPGGTSGRAILAVGAEAPSGRMIFTLRELDEKFTVPPIPRPIITMNSHGSGWPMEAELTIIDPIALAAAQRQRELDLQRAHRPRTITVASTAVLVVLVAAGSWLGYQRWIAPPKLEAATTMNPSMQSSNGSFSVEATDGGYRVTWFGLPSVINNLRIETSFDGQSWATVPGAFIDFRTNSAEFKGVFQSYIKLRFQPVANRIAYGAPQIWPDLPAAGMVDVPGVQLTESGVRVAWEPAPDDLGNAPASFRYRYAFRQPEDWIYGLTTERQVELASLDGSTLYVEVQSVFQDRSKGPWISAVPTQLSSEA